jgi:hypothetical protein
MKYTKHFSKTIKGMGVPHLNSDQLTRFMNVVYLEAVIETYEGLGINSPTIFSKSNNKQNKLKRLTKDLSPEDFLKELVSLSTN